MATPTELTNQITKLRAIADYIAAHQPYLESLPGLEGATWGQYTDENGNEKHAYLDADGKPATHVNIYVSSYSLDISVHGSNAKNVMAEIRRNLGGKWEKAGYGETFTLHQEREHFSVEIDGPRAQVCTAIQTGTRTVERTNPDAPKIKVEEPIIEWECDPMLLGEGQ